MTKRTKIIIASVGLVLFGYYMMNKRKKSMAEQADFDTKPSAITENNTLSFVKVLENGTRSEEVKALQKALKGGLVVDGIFGNLTEARLKEVTGKTKITLQEYNNIILNK